MVKYQVVYVQCGGWCVLITGKAAEERYYGFRDEDHARDWIAEKLEKKQLACTLSVLAT